MTPERAAKTQAILEGAEFPYEVVGYGATPEEAVAWAQAWAAGSKGPGSALYGRTVPVSWGQAYQPDWFEDWRTTEWRVPVQWQVATPLPAAAELSVLALLPGDIVYTDTEPLRVMSPAAGRRTGYREIGAPSIEVHVYAQQLGEWPASERHEHARHLSWPAGAVVQVARP